MKDLIILIGLVGFVASVIALVALFAQRDATKQREAGAKEQPKQAER